VSPGDRGTPLCGRRALQHTVLMNIAAGLLPVFFALAVGFVAGKSGFIDSKHVDGFNTLVMKIALPIALFTILASAKRSDVIEHSSMAGAVLLVMGLTYLGTYVLQRRAYGETTASSAIQALTVAFPNTAAVGLPIADAVLGRTGGLAVAISLAVGSIALSPVTIVIVGRASSGPAAPQSAGASQTKAGSGILKAVGGALRTPVVIAPIVGLIWSFVGLPFPTLLDQTLTEVGGLTAGLALVLTGLVLSTQQLKPTGNVVVSTLIGDIIRPLLAIAVVKVFGLGGPMAAEIVLLMAVPSGFFGVLLALSHRVDPKVAGPTLFYSTILSIGTLAAVIVLLPLL